MPKINVEEEAQEIEEELDWMGITHGADFFNAEFESDKVDIIDGMGFHISDRMTCDRTKLYLDTCATNYTMFARERLERIHKVGMKLRQHCNAGATTTGRMGYWKGIKFRVNESGIANLLSVPQLANDGYELEYSTASGWLVHTPAGNTIHFLMDEGMCGGMPFIDLVAHPGTYLSRRDGVAMIQTVRKNFEGYTKRQVEGAKQARDMQAMMAHPSDSAMKHMVSQTNAVKNCPVTVTDITNARAIFGPDRAGVRGKTVRQRPAVVRPEYVGIPAALFERIKNVTLTADVMFVNGLPFCVTLSRDIKLITIEFLPSRTVPMLCATLKKTVAIYKQGGFTVRTCLMDMEFEKMIHDMDEVVINTTAAREHVGDIERCIRTIKEQARSVTSELPYKKYMPKKIVINLLKFVTMWLNAMPSGSGVSTVLSPRVIVT
eukprot:CCRYP_021222-RA/>CCRYP_021222-RA protein AED:0.36 eAED:-0.92 QI:0/-1/0/1/-1/1/1/0/432